MFRSGNQTNSQEDISEFNSENSETARVGSRFDRFVEQINNDPVSNSAYEFGSYLSSIPVGGKTKSQKDWKVEVEDPIPNLQFRNFSNRFIAQMRLAGVIADVGQNGLHSAVLSDEDGNKFKYEFSTEELPPNQRPMIAAGKPIIVLIGLEYEGMTQRRKAKVYLALYDTAPKRRLAETIFEEARDRWSF